MELVLATRNESKREQIKALLVGMPIKILSLDDTTAEGEAVEDGDTLKKNAFRKAVFAWNHRRQYQQWCVADDTGIFIDALNGKPGIYAARWAGEGATTAEIQKFTLAQLRDVPWGKRTARFETVAVLVGPHGGFHVHTGRLRGRLLVEPRVEPRPKMPYSALFVPDGYGEALAELSPEEELAISHRGLAFKKVRTFLEKQLTQTAAS